MRNKVKDINIKTRTYYLFDHIINVKNLDPNNIKIHEKSYRSILIYYIEHVTIKDLKYVKINSVSPLYLIFNKVNGYFEEINGNKYLTLKGGSQFDLSPVAFRKIHPPERERERERERVKPWFCVTFNIIISHIFSENLIEIPEVVQKI